MIARWISGNIAPASPATLTWVRESCAHELLRSCCQKFRYHDRVRLLQRVKPLEVLHDTDDFNAVTARRIINATNRPAVRPDVAGEGLVHDGDARTPPSCRGHRIRDPRRRRRPAY